LTTYLDHAATTPLRPEVVAAMAEATAEPLGNPTGSHPPAQRARRLLEEARDTVAAVLGRPPGEVVFTSGGTESANLAVLGSLEAIAPGGHPPVILCSAIVHPAVLESCRAAERRLGATLHLVSVDGGGLIDLQALQQALGQGADLLALMLANNETGVVQPVALAATLAAKAARPERDGRPLVFTDAVQASSYLDLAEATAGADLVSISAHKVGGPVGTGVLVMAADSTLEPRQYGGGQERERRSGTQDVVGAVGLATALALASAEREATTRRVGALRDRLAQGLVDALDQAHRTVPPDVPTLPGHLHLCLSGIEREELLVLLGEQGICASGGSSCASGALEPSHVLAAMGVPDELAAGSLRLTLGASSTEVDVDRALAVIPTVVASLRHAGRHAD
jgi:cysteine desulfurase